MALYPSKMLKIQLKLLPENPMHIKGVLFWRAVIRICDKKIQQCNENIGCAKLHSCQPVGCAIGGHKVGMYDGKSQDESDEGVKVQIECLFALHRSNCPSNQHNDGEYEACNLQAFHDKSECVTAASYSLCNEI